MGTPNFKMAEDGERLMRLAALLSDRHGFFSGAETYLQGLTGNYIKVDHYQPADEFAADIELFKTDLGGFLVKLEKRYAPPPA